MSALENNLKANAAIMAVIILLCTPKYGDQENFLFGIVVVVFFGLLPIQNIINAVIDNTLTVSFCNNNFLTSFKDELKREGDETCKNNEKRA